MDSENVAYFGEWMMASNSPTTRFGYYLGTRWAKKGAGDARAVFVPNVPRTDSYVVYAHFGPDPSHDHASKAPVIVRYANGEKTVRVDLRSTAGVSGTQFPKHPWVQLGTFRFAAGRKGSITCSNKADGNVLADAVKLVISR